MIKTIRRFSLSLASCLLMAACNQDHDSTSVSSSGSLEAGQPVQTANGQISGTPGEAEGVLAFKGIPFAAPPVGELRWRPAMPAQNWSGVRAGHDYASPCMQPYQPNRSPNNRSVDLPDSPAMSEDCLYLNLWTPAKDPGEGLPVMVWIFGGAYSEGAGSTPHNRGDQLAAKGVVVVSFNYRLGALGFLAHPELSAESPDGASGNYALTDALQALRWVQANIAAFGGDPDNVTIFGESAGSAIAAGLVGSPLSKGLFHRAIAESGNWMGLNLAPMVPRQTVEQQTIQTTQEIGGLSALRALPAADVSQLRGPGMIIDGWVIPEDLSLTFAAGRQNPVDVIVGSNRDEGSFASGFGPPMTIDRWINSSEDRWGELTNLGMQAYPAASDEEAAAQNDSLFTDNMAWIMRLFGAQQRAIGKQSYVYHFVHKPPYEEGARDLGVCHTCEIPYVFNNLGALRVYPDASSPSLALASEEDRKVAELMSSYWVNFAASGNPNGPGLPEWPLLESLESGPVLHIDASPETAESLGPAKLSFYQALYDQMMENL